MRISDWSSDVGSSDLSKCNSTAISFHQHTPDTRGSQHSRHSRLGDTRKYLEDSYIGSKRFMYQKWLIRHRKNSSLIKFDGYSCFRKGRIIHGIKGKIGSAPCRERVCT